VATQAAQRRNCKVDKPKRPIRIEGDIAFIPLTKGHEAIIDAGDVPLADGRLWQALVVRRKDGSIRTIYATSRTGDGRTVYLHRLIAGEPEGAEVDHRDGDGLLNVRSNLRVCSTSQNNCNRRVSIRNTSGLKGASWNASVGKWLARIKVNGKQHNLGHFLTPEEAHAAYVAASLKYHGEFGNHG
jgi:hypothetical protein